MTLVEVLAEMSPGDQRWLRPKDLDMSGDAFAAWAAGVDHSGGDGFALVRISGSSPHFVWNGSVKVIDLIKITRV